MLQTVNVLLTFAQNACRCNGFQFIRQRVGCTIGITLRNVNRFLKKSADVLCDKLATKSGAVFFSETPSKYFCSSCIYTHKLLSTFKNWQLYLMSRVIQTTCILRCYTSILWPSQAYYSITGLDTDAALSITQNFLRSNTAVQGV